MIKTAADLRPAGYNPRTITQKRLEALGNSIESFGDLSGIVFNQRTRTTISGHQRTASLKRWPSKSVLKDFKDEFGTIKIGHMEWKTDQGIVRVPLRIVDWDRNKEKSANIAANAHGGDFDRQKLSTLVGQLEKGKTFDIEMLGMDAHDLVMLHKLMPKNAQPSDDSDDYDSDGREFESVVPKLEESKKNMVCCPKCKFNFKP